MAGQILHDSLTLTAEDNQYKTCAGAADSACFQASLYSAVQTMSRSFIVANTRNNFTKLAKPAGLLKDLPIPPV